MVKLSVNRLEYEAILQANKEALALLKVDKTRGPAPNIGSFISTKDMRQVAAGMRINIDLKKTASTSFNVNTLQCYGCSGHDGQPIWKPKGASMPL
jgi:hypothetical protein